MKRTTLIAALCLTALLAAGCTETPAPAPEELTAAPTEAVETEESAETESPSEAEEPTYDDESAYAEAAESRPQWEEELREKERQAKQEVDGERYAAQFEEKHRLYKESGAALVEGAESWQSGYAKLLTSGEARYLADEPLKDDAVMSYYLLHIEDTDSPNLVVLIPSSDGSNYYALLIFRYENGSVTYLCTSSVNEWDGDFYYRPYRGDVGCTMDLMMSKRVYSVIWHLGENTTYSFLNTVFDTTEHQLTDEQAERFDIIIKKDTDRSDTGSFGESWVSVYVGNFRPITPDTIALLYQEN